MTDGGYYAIKGFEFQIDKTIITLLNADNDSQVYLEQIQDINTDNFVMQVKYKEAQKYTPAKIKEPVIQLIEEYKKEPTKNYYLYCYFNNVDQEKRTFTKVKLDGVLGNKKNNFSQKIKNDFCSKFELHFSKTFQEQFVQAVSGIKDASSCSSFDEALIFYGNIANHLRKIVVNNTMIKNRICTKSEILEIITNNRKTVFDSAYRIYKGKDQYLAEIKKRHFTYRNIDYWERFVVVELNGSENISNIKSAVLDVKNKFYKKLARGIKSGAPYVYLMNISKEKLKKLKEELISENNSIKDGYDFMDASFCKNSLKVKSTIENGISIKFVNDETCLKQMLGCDLGCTKKIYHFYQTEPIELFFDIDTVNIKIDELSEMQQILT